MDETMSTNYDTLHIERPVSQRLAAHKKMLEDTYKLELTWSHFLYLLIKNNQSQDIGIDDITDTPKGMLELEDLTFNPKKLVNGYGAYKVCKNAR
jgi:hypothetical protein